MKLEIFQREHEQDWIWWRDPNVGGMNCLCANEGAGLRIKTLLKGRESIFVNLTEYKSRGKKNANG